jgi:amino acid permease
MIFFSYFGIYESKLMIAIANAISSKGQGGVILSFILCGIDMLLVMISLTLSGNDSNKNSKN